MSSTNRSDYSLQILTCIHYSEPVQEYRNGESWTQPLCVPEEPAHTLMKIATEVAESKAAARELFDLKGCRPSNNDIVGLITRLNAVDCELLHWQQSLPGSWKSHSLTVKESDRTERADRDTWDGWVYLHSDVWVSVHVTAFHVLRLHVNAVWLRALQESGIEQEEPQSVNDCRNRLRHIADDICACVAPAIGNILSKPDLPPGIATSSISGRAVVSSQALSGAT